MLQEARRRSSARGRGDMSEMVDEYAAIAEWDVSAQQANEGFTRRTINPTLRHMKVGVELAADAYLFSNGPVHVRP